MTHAAQAREAAGLTLEQAAKRARVSVRYLRHVERHGAGYALARRLSHIYNCSLATFLYPTDGETLNE
jgi:transcriptional regulator with XRE-family HTH domain